VVSPKFRTYLPNYTPSHRGRLQSSRTKDSWLHARRWQVWGEANLLSPLEMEKSCKWCELVQITTKEALLRQSHVQTLSTGKCESEAIAGCSQSSRKVMDRKGKKIVMISLFLFPAV
jgi:hypothetical protein